MKPFFVDCYGVRLPLNRLVPQNYDSEKESALELPYILPDEGLYHVNTAIQTGTIVLMTRHDGGAFYGQKEGIITPAILMSVSFFINCCR